MGHYDPLDVITPSYIVYAVLVLILLDKFLLDSAWAWYILVQLVVGGAIGLIRWGHLKRSSDVERLPLYVCLPCVLYSTTTVHIFALGYMARQYRDAEFWWVFILLETIMFFTAGVLGLASPKPAAPADGGALHSSKLLLP
jgi:hypothetical protein